ncbi:unnamed protein product [Brassicogethes aeneus]|uniref:Uncharacterized protein n=1 Tax=Brassicogethes aeneus TaxID=1431903 RepID=A0A9P0AQE5_BRAAE|nr:unnamed protein product [Brassicogethes aeneus]
MKQLLLMCLLMTVVHGKCLLGFQYTSPSNRTLFTSCKNVVSKNLEALKNIQPFSRMKFLDLMNYSGSFKNSTLSAFPDLDVLHIQESSFTDLTKDVLGECCRNLTKIVLRNNNVNLDKDVFQSSKKLKSIVIYNENIPKVDTVFKGLSELDILILNNSKVEDIGEHSFSDLVNLQLLELNYNDIKEIEPKTFEPLGNLKTLTIFNNIDLNITMEAFSKLKNLETLGLNTEVITKYDIEDLKKTLPKLKTIVFKKQDKTCNKVFLERVKSKNIDVNYVTFPGEPICINKIL